MNENHLRLKHFLESETIPKIKKQPKTFLGIAKQPHYENVLTNIYAFYFNVNEVHRFGEVFIASLLELIEEKLGKDVKDFDSFSDFYVATESPTQKGGRIDLLLFNDENAIILENKVYHTLNNDLIDYWDTIIKGRETNAVVGIVFSLFSIQSTNHPQFINITHKQLLTRVMNNIGGYIMEANTKYLVFLKDLYQNTLNMSTKAMKSEDIQFYKEHRDNIHQTARFLNRFKDHVKKEVEAACNLLNGESEYLNLKGTTSNRLRYYESKANPDLMFTIGFDNLFRDDRKNIWVVVELKGDALHDRDVYKEIVFTPGELRFIKEHEFYTEKNRGWAHFAVAFYPYEIIDFEDLRNYLVNKIKEDKLLSIFNKLNDFLTDRKK
ncbi:MAG: hypothetical protein CMC70_04290 [Flavobacteriaceae bacterium]|nr:hypothetical protein [Flavobacteriaceae bacterium]